MKIRIVYHKEVEEVLEISDKFAPMLQTDTDEWTDREEDLNDELHDILDDYVTENGCFIMGYDFAEEK